MKKNERTNRLFEQDFVYCKLRAIFNIFLSYELDDTIKTDSDEYLKSDKLLLDDTIEKTQKQTDDDEIA